MVCQMQNINMTVFKGLPIVVTRHYNLTIIQASIINYQIEKHA